MTAKVQGVRVEVLSERSETTRVWIHPDGVVEEEDALGEVRFPDESAADGWRDIDTTLEARSDGSIQPKAVPVDVALGTGSDELVVFDKGGEGEVGFTLEGVTLPAPVLDGSTATYADVLPGVDASVEVRSGGFEVLWVVKTPEAAELLVETYGDDAGQVVLPAKLRSKIAPAATADGGVEFKQLGESAGEFAAPSMWDSSAEVPGARGAETDVEFDLAPAVQARSARVAPAESSRGLGVVADEEWLTAQDRVFPIVIDPTYQSVSGGVTFDTWVQNGVTTDKSAAADLRIGNDGTGMVARSFLNFDAALFKNRQVRRANLSLYGSYSSTCSQTEFAAYDAGLASTSSRWTAQPTLGAKRATSTSTVGKSASCPAARVSIDMTAQAQGWSSTTASQVGMMLGATNVTDAFGWKIFHSSEGQNKPAITVWFNRAPNQPVAPTVAGVVSATTSSGVKNFIGVAKPTISVPVKDADVDTVTAVISRFTSATSTTPAAELCRGTAASGGTVKCTSVADLPANSSVWIRATAGDGMGWSGYGPAVEVRYGAATPHAPIVSCPTANGSWGTAVKAKETCTITAKQGTASASSPTSGAYRVNGGAWKTVTFTQITADTQIASVQIGGTEGVHSVEAYVKSPVGKQSATTAYTFGYGKPSLLSPAATLTTHGAVTVKAKGAPTSAGALQWRVKGSGETWRDIDGTVGPVDADGEIETSFDVAAALGAAQVSSRVSVVIEVRGRFTFGTTAPLYTNVREIVRVPHAFGAGFPTTEVATGEVALWTGELQVTETDAELTTPGGGLSISRTHSTWAVPAEGPQSVFGPGWAASLDGGPTGVSELELVDNTATDGTLVLTSTQGDVMPFAPLGAVVRATTVIPSGRYLPIGPDSEGSGLMLEVLADGDAIRVTVTDSEGGATVYRAPALMGATARARFSVDSETDSVSGETTMYRYNAAGLVDAIIAPLPDGVTGECLPGTPKDGCRILKLGYTGTGTATRLTTITAQVNTDADRVLSTYTYTSGRLTGRTDAVTGLTTSYTWTGTDPQPRLASIKPHDQDAINFTYTSSATNAKLSKVTRAIPSTAGGGTAQLAAIVYNVAPASIGDLDLTQFTDYNLPRTATTSFAVFGPDAPITSTPAASDEKWKRADVWLTDAEGYTIHEARYGAGEWQLTANIYDASDNVIEAWDTRATAEIRKGDNSAYTDIASAATKTVYNETDIKAADGTTVLVPARTRVTDVYSPAAMILAEGATAPEMLRRHAATLYDQRAPEPGMSLATTETVTMENLDGTVVETLWTSFAGYAALETGDKAGWELKQATSTTVDMNGNGEADAADIRTETRYDAQGRVIEQRQPGAGSTDPGTRATIFWSAGTNSRDAACGGQPKWAGYICKEGPASQPAGTTTPVTIRKDYLWHGATATQQDVSGQVTRTVTTTFDAKERPETVTTSVTGLPGAEPVPSVTTSYDSLGQVTGTTSSAGSTAMTYDSWGRQLTYTITPAGGGTPETTTTVYNTLGDVASVTTPKSTTVNTYDGTDANGNTEYRGLLTKTVTTVGTFTTTSQAAYDANGQLVLEKLPAGIQRETSYDLTGELVDQQYKGPGPEGLTEWFAWSITANAAGQIVSEISPEVSPTSQEGTTTADVRYAYDRAGRLTGVSDTAQGQCTTRQYAFDKRGNRQGVSENTDTSCTGTAPTTRWTYDTADRPLASGASSYTYDQLGRQLSIPAVDTPNPANGDIALGYYDDDSARSITQGNTVLSYGLDVAGRRATQITTTAGAVTGTVINHYTDDSDNPGWITTNTSGALATTVYTEQVSSDLSMSIISDETGTRGELAIVTPRGDIAATITINTPDAVADGIDSWTRYTEYGQPLSAQPAGTAGAAGNGYGWLGAKQRTTTTAGLLLMGARLYNPITGLFTSNDPIHGGNDTPYTYPGDPINKEDTSGLWSRSKSKIIKGYSRIKGPGAIGWMTITTYEVLWTINLTSREVAALRWGIGGTAAAAALSAIPKVGSILAIIATGVASVGAAFSNPKPVRIVLSEPKFKNGRNAGIPKILSIKKR